MLVDFIVMLIIIRNLQYCNFNHNCLNLMFIIKSNASNNNACLIWESNENCIKTASFVKFAQNRMYVCTYTHGYAPMTAFKRQNNQQTASLMRNAFRPGKTTCMSTAVRKTWQRERERERDR